MKRLTLTKTLILFILPAVLFAFTTRADKAMFAGSWKLNEDKSELGDFGGRFAPRKIKVDQKDDAITISKTSPSFNGGDPTTTTETLSYDGKVSETTGFGNSKKKSTLKWADDGQSMTISYTIAFERNGETSEIKGTETWTLSADGKNLTSTVSSTSSQGEFTMKEVFDKE
jgi:hypothetical protein